MDASVTHEGCTLGTTPGDGAPSVISIMPNSSSQRSKSLDIRVAGRDMHATSSNLNFTLKIDVGYPESPRPKEPQRKQDEMKRWGSMLVSIILGILRTSFPSVFLSSSEEHRPSSVPGSPAQAHTPSDLAQDGVETDLAHRPQDVPDVLPTKLAYHEVYVHTLLGEKLGLPCWEPRPLGLGNQVRGTVPGDVGTYTTEGGFHRLFNLWEDQATLCSLSDTCRTSVGCQGVSTKYHTTPDWMKGGDAIACGASTETPLKRLSERPRVDVLYEFVCDSSSGAVLATPTSADKDEAEDIIEMERYIRTHAEAIYRHANAIRLIGEASSLYVVTDCIKSDTWAMAAYKGEMNPNRNILELVSVSQSSDGGSDCMPEYKWTKRGSAHARWGSSAGGEGVKNQTLFLRGLKLAFSAKFRSRVHRIKAGNDNSNSSEPIDGGSNTLRDPPDSPDAGFQSQAEGGRSGGEVSDQQPLSIDSSQSLSMAPLSIAPETSNAGDHNLDLAPFPNDSTLPYHPSDVINACVLEQTGFDVAICHDSAWELLSEVSSVSSTTDATDTMPQLLRHLALAHTLLNNAIQAIGGPHATWNLAEELETGYDQINRHNVAYSRWKVIVQTGAQQRILSNEAHLDREVGRRVACISALYELDRQHPEMKIIGRGL
ncbi:hypothetical protein FA13DRAFT_815837 [Coprinellus micaceus]|uniref:Uncharacterized protein n=1 Tax=Coprinellus micaceus TaxID=71717 RepID=A0A4Y7T2M9_COPMI|nr:hypothetical protein FA13DRAFT_815837 [Coprinellus micaceus]